MSLEGKPAIVSLDAQGAPASVQLLNPPPGTAADDFFAVIQSMCRSADGQNTPLAVVSQFGDTDRISLWNGASGEFTTHLADLFLAGACQGGVITLDEGRYLYVVGGHPARLLGVAPHTLISAADYMGVTDPAVDVRFTGISTDSLTEFSATMLFVTPQEGSTEVIYTRTNATPFTNDVNPLEVNNDTYVSPLDALLVINWLNSSKSRTLDLSSPVPPAFMDTNGDLYISPIDALRVINHLNLSGTSGEGEAPAALLGQAAGGDDLKSVAETPLDLASASLPSPLPDAAARMKSFFSWALDRHRKMGLVKRICG
jgi:hypothetical protein